MLNVFEILMRRQDKVLVKKELDKTSESKVFKVFTVARNLKDYGYCLDKELIKKIFLYSDAEICDFYKNVVFCIKKLTGGDKDYNPMYPNFPEQVMNMSELELFVNANYHYFHSFLKDLGFDFGSGLKEYKKEEKEEDKYEYKLKKLSIGTEKDLLIIFENLLNSKVSLSSQDYKDIVNLLNYFIKNKIDYKIPSEIKNKEVLANFFSYLISSGVDFDYNKYLNNPIDVLRICAVMSNCKADLSCFEDICFDNFKRSHRRLFLSVLDSISCDFKKAIEISKRYRSLFVILGEKLHPGEKKYKKSYPNAFNFFFHLRNKVKVNTDIEYIEESIKNGKMTDKLINLLMKKTSLFARKLDKLLRMCSDDKKRIGVIDSFSKCVGDLEASYLIQLYKYFKDRNEIIDVGKKTYTPKTSLKNSIRTFEFKKNKFSSEVEESILNVLSNGIINKLKTKSKLGKVYIDKELENYNMPFSLRSSSSAYKQLVRGSKVKIDEDLNDIRFFLWWNDNGEERIDLDLSLTFVGDGYGFETISYTNLRCEDIKAVHSGDITSAPNGACEFVDLNIDEAVKKGYKYCVMSLVSFNGVNFSDIKDCLCGWMERRSNDKGEIYDIKTVKNKFVVSSNTKSTISCFIDLKEKRLVWEDSDIFGSRDFVTMSEEELGVMDFLQMIKNMHKPTLYDLFMFHAKARADKIVTKKEDADIIFSADDDSNVYIYDNSVIVGEYM